MARKPSTKKTAKSKTSAAKRGGAAATKAAENASATNETSSATGGKTARRTRAEKTAQVPTAPAVATVLHGETRLNSTDEDGRAALQDIIPILDAAHAGGRIRITGASHSSGTVWLNAVMAQAVPDRNPGVVLAIDLASGELSFDRVKIGRVGAELVENAAHDLLAGITPSEGDAVRVDDWYRVAIEIAENLGRSA